MALTNADMQDRISKIGSVISGMGPLVTAFNASSIEENFRLLRVNEIETIKSLGINIEGKDDFVIAVPINTRKYGNIRIQNYGSETFFVIGHPHGNGALINIRIFGDKSDVIFPDISKQRITIGELSLRSNEQTFLFGIGSTSVNSFFELHGDRRIVAVGDDCMISSSVWIRNFDMHSVFDLKTGENIGKPHCDVIIEQHVWLGQDVLVLGANRIGYGSIVGAQSMVRSSVPCRSLVVGTPGRIIRNEVGWSRSPVGVTPQDISLYARLASLDADASKR